MIMKSSWVEESSIEETLTIALTLAHHEASLSGSFRTELTGLLDRRDWEGLLSFDFRYNENRDVMDYVHARQCIGFFEKLEPLGEILGLDREAKAYAKFLDSEKSCAETNEFFRLYQRGKLCFTPAFERVLYAAKWKIGMMLGVAPTFQQLRPKLGPGASTSVKRRKACAAEKLSTRLACSINFIPYLPLFTATQPQLVQHHAEARFETGGDCEVTSSSGVYRLETVETFTVHEDVGMLTFVKKDAKSYRSIVVEPGLSSMYQLALGNAMAVRLKRNGIDIENQARNIDLARYGSVSGALATLDLSSASDTISVELVRFLLPDDWYSLLDGFRSPIVEYKGQTIHLEKFSSMGNAATFPLETLIFYALVWASSPHHERGFISAYGDDLICGSDSALTVVETLESCGFTINLEKSFVRGPFRESCGADYYLGVNIRPYRLKCDKGLISNMTLFTMYNFFKRNLHSSMCDLILSYIHPDVILWGPDGYGDGHLVCEDPVLKRHKRDSGWGGFTFDTYTLRARRSTRLHPGDYLQVLYSVYVAEDAAPTTSSRKAAGGKGEVIKTFPLTGAREYKRISIYTLTR